MDGWISGGGALDPEYSDPAGFGSKPDPQDNSANSSDDLQQSWPV